MFNLPMEFGKAVCIGVIFGIGFIFIYEILKSIIKFILKKYTYQLYNKKIVNNSIQAALEDIKEATRDAIMNRILSGGKIVCKYYISWMSNKYYTENLPLSFNKEGYLFYKDFDGQGHVTFKVNVSKEEVNKVFKEEYIKLYGKYDLSCLQQK